MKVLHITSELDGGGVERLLYDYCSRMIPHIEFDFVVTSKTKGILEQPLIDLGCQVFHISSFRDGINKHNKQILDIIINGKYDIVHDHSGFKAFFNLYLAKKCDVKTRIAHSHQAYMVENMFGKLIRKTVTPLTKLIATDLFACGIDAATWMWGEKLYNCGKVRIMTNAINVPVFKYSELTRSEMRKALNLTNKFVVGNVARFSYQKNHDFLIDIFAAIKHSNKDAVLLLIGGGELESSIRTKVQALGLNDCVLFLGVRDDVPQLMSAMDAFVLPSRFEGLPVTLVEAQAASLPCYVSDSITKEISITKFIEYIPLSYSVDMWAEKILATSSEPRSDNSEVISRSGYDIEIESKKMQEWYMSAIKR